MVAIPGGTFLMGSDRFYPEEAPARQVRVDPFWIDATPVTNRAFAAFVADTGHVSLAETAPDPRDYPGMPADMARAGSLLFVSPPRVHNLHDVTQWWQFRFGADWRHPTGPDSTLDGLEEHPVVHIAYDDALAYAGWAGRELPTEAEWEFAARGGLDDADYAWGDTLAPGGTPLANYWQGRFPVANDRLDNWDRTSPTRSFPPNGYGLHDMIGNVWEWTQDWYGDRSRAPTPGCCIPANPRGGRRADSHDPHDAGPAIGRKVLKGGSHLCAENYRRRYRPAARYPQPVDTSTCHVGFRCVVRSAPPHPSPI